MSDPDAAFNATNRLLSEYQALRYQVRSMEKTEAMLRADKLNMERRFLAEKTALQAALRHRIGIRDIDDHPYPCAECETAIALSGFSGDEAEDDSDDD